MSQPLASQALNQKRSVSLLEKISSILLREPEDRAQLFQILRAAHRRNLLDADALSMIEGVLQVSELSARSIMVPRSQMDMIDVSLPLPEVIAQVVQATHSRFPVYENHRDHIVGILLAKDLLRYALEPDFDLRDMLRPAVFIPESKRLNVLLRNFRDNRNHMAIVVDEYGSVSGLITIDNVIEQIVGDIEDEFDFDEVSDNIVLFETKGTRTFYRVRALTEIEQFNGVFGTEFDTSQANTIGGLLSDHLGRVPRRGEIIEIFPMRFEILRADARQVHLLKVELLDNSFEQENTVQLPVEKQFIGSNGNSE
jgi:magnesium and cobalt transporter